LNAEPLRGITFADLARAQAGLDRHTPSPRVWSETVGPFDCVDDGLLRRIQPNGRIKPADARRVGATSPEGQWRSGPPGPTAATPASSATSASATST
jgi:hypothetical protein